MPASRNIRIRPSEAKVRTTQLEQVWFPLGPDSRLPSLLGAGRPGFQNTYPYPERTAFAREPRKQVFPTWELENEYLKATLVPGLGARLFSLYDKITQREVFLRPDVIRPAPILLRGAFAPFGVELNFPSGHTVHAFEEVPCVVCPREDGVAEVEMHVFNAATRIDTIVSFSLHPGERKLRQKTTFRNLLPVRNGFMYWANAAVENTPGLTFQVRAPACHFFTDYAPFPTIDGVDFRISRNRTFGSDLFAIGSPDDWFGFYLPEHRCGALHLAPQAQMQGKKFFTYGFDEFGFRWGRYFGTPEHGYVEIQAGILETQFEFTHLEPFGSKVITEAWVPYHDLGDVLHADDHFIVSDSPEGFRLAAIHRQTDVRVTVVSPEGVVQEENLREIDPAHPRNVAVPGEAGRKMSRIRIESGGHAMEALLSTLEPSTAAELQRRQAVLDGDGGTRAGRLELAWRAYKSRRFAEANNLLQEADLPDAEVLRRDLAMLRSQSFGQTLAVGGSADRWDVHAALGQAEACYLEGDVTGALGALDAWVQGRKNPPQLVCLVISFLEAGCGTTPPKSLELIGLGEAGAPAPSTSLDCAALEWAAGCEKHSPEPPLLLGNYWSRWDEGRAVSYWEEALHRDGNCWLAARNLAWHLVRHRTNLERACQLYRQASELSGWDPAVIAEFVRASRLNGKTADALALIESFPLAVLNHDQVVKLRVELLRDRERFQEALDLIESISCDLPIWEGETGIHRCRVECLVALGTEAMKTGAWADAESAFSRLFIYPEHLVKARATGDNEAIAWYHLGLLHEAQGLCTLANDDFRKAVSEPQFHPLHWTSFLETEYYGALAARKLGQGAAMLQIANRLASVPFPEFDPAVGHDPVPNECPYAVHLARARGLALLGRGDEAQLAARAILTFYGDSHPYRLGQHAELHIG